MLLLSSVSVRIVNGNAPNEGRVEVFHRCFWGTICDSGWSIRDAHVICRQLGYLSASQALRGAHFGQGTGPILLEYVSCNGTESDIEHCNHGGWFNHNCQHERDVGVICIAGMNATSSLPGKSDNNHDIGGIWFG